MALSKKRRNSLPCTVRTSRQSSCNQRVGCLKRLKYKQYDIGQDLIQRYIEIMPRGVFRPL